MSTTLLDKVKRDYYTLGQAAQELELNPATLWRWIKDGKLPAERLGREVLIEKKAVDALRK
jgi:excisionase family DNA binding protein